VDTQSYRSEYTNSWALVVGINNYDNAPPLEFACNDAQTVGKVLIDEFDFPEANVILLTDKESSRSGIMEAFLGLMSKTEPDDRILVYFAGHGHTRTGLRGEVGFLVPVDGTLDRLASLIRWDELTRDADLIPAKHIFFVMDACYGGLALTRGLPSGSMRFLKDMLKRVSRQVLTAGKADEVVADSDGPLPDHSVFTGHFLQALGGKAATQDGIITANGVMSYVYEKVAKDQYSQQTPHYGFIDGDGDFVFRAPVLDEIVELPGTASDVLVEVPPTIVDASGLDYQNLIDLVKEYISDARYRIKLDDLVTKEVRKALSLTTGDSFPVQNVEVTAEELSNRLVRYELIMRSLQAITVLLAHWGGQDQTPVLRKIVGRVAERQGSMSGVVAWLNLRWYPAAVLMYSGGIGAIAGRNYGNLATLLLTPVCSDYGGEKQKEAILAIVDGLLDQADVFKSLPEHERYHVPHSEYLFKMLQPNLDDLLFLGRNYEATFDRFEVFLALVYADLFERKHKHTRGPLGRFGWKFRSPRSDSSPFIDVTEEAARQQDDWPPLKAGLFGASYQRFSEVASRYREEILDRLHWF
jgi:hypothetical protein